MSLKTLIELAKSIIMIEEEMHVKEKCIVKYHQKSNSESNDFDEEDQQHKPKGKKMKVHFDTYQ
jgi:hypothetical protein